MCQHPQTSKSNTRCSRQESWYSKASILISPARSHQTARRNRFQHCRITAQWKEKYNCWCHPVLGQETPHEGTPCANIHKQAKATPDAADRKSYPSKASILITPARSHQTARPNLFRHCLKTAQWKHCRKTAQWKEKYYRSTIAGVISCWGRKPLVKACHLQHSERSGS